MAAGVETVGLDLPFGLLTSAGSDWTSSVHPDARTESAGTAREKAIQNIGRYIVQPQLGRSLRPRLRALREERQVLGVGGVRGASDAAATIRPA